MIWKPKRKEKSKRGKRVRWLLLSVLLLLIGVLAALLVIGKNAKQTAAAIAEAVPDNCYYTTGYGDNPNSSASQSLYDALKQARVVATNVSLVDNLREYYVCGSAATPLYQTCAWLEISLPVNDSSPTRGQLGNMIGSVLEVIQSTDICTPEELRVTFETTSGNIYWQMTTYYAMQAYQGGARGEVLYNANQQ